MRNVCESESGKPMDRLVFLFLILLSRLLFECQHQNFDDYIIFQAPYIFDILVYSWMLLEIVLATSF